MPVDAPLREVPNVQLLSDSAALFGFPVAVPLLPTELEPAVPGDPAVAPGAELPPLPPAPVIWPPVVPPIVDMVPPVPALPGVPPVEAPAAPLAPLLLPLAPPLLLPPLPLPPLPPLPPHFTICASTGASTAA